MIFDALSNAAYRESLRGPGAEIGGGSQQPPPSRWWKIYGPSRARVNKILNEIHNRCNIFYHCFSWDIFISALFIAMQSCDM